jgi:hypothetical protein
MNEDPVRGGNAGCYRCGEAEGGESRLCPKCTAWRLSELELAEEHLALGPLRDRERSIADLAAGSRGRILIALVIGLLVAAHFLVSPWGPGWALSPGEQAYRRCLTNARELFGAGFAEHESYWRELCEQHRRAAR